MILHYREKRKKYLIFASKCLVNPHKSCTFALANKEQGALDEWLSLRSAKPSTAVRIRQAPQPNKRVNNISSLSFALIPLHTNYLQNLQWGTSG